MILLVAEIHAAKTILASFAVIAIVAVRTYDAVAAKIAVVAALDIDAFVAEFGFFRECAVNAVARNAEPKSIHAIFGFNVPDDEVAVFSCRVIRTPSAIFASDGKNARMRPRFAERLKALEEI